ncbi:4'-phosphopantetheinyl transferase superfamily protein [Scytonema sp. NUACC21]
MTVDNSSWQPAPTNLTLLQDEVHVWRINLDQPDSQLQHLAATLSSDEVCRAKRFYKEQHRQRFIAGRGILRTILGRYLGIEPQELQFCYEPSGKPVLADSFADRKLWFNLTHSQGLALCAVTSARQVGVDLEYVRPISDVLSLANRFFSPAEYGVLSSLPPHQVQEVFFRYWTCKEAYLKATGVGIAQLEQIEVLLTPGQPAKLKTEQQWSLLEIIPENNSVAAIAVQGSGMRLKCFQY